MAKMFYTLDETKTALGKNEEDVKQLSREGRLREFRDGPRLMFKVDQVEALKQELGGIDQVDLGPSDSGMAIGLSDSKGGSASGTGLTLADTDGSRGSGVGITLKEDTALAADLGLSGSMGGVPSPGRLSGSMAGHSSRSGVDVFAGDEVEKVDPSAQTAISPGISDQISMEGVGSGSGLLDLSKESDDTSLGSELLDEITPSGTGIHRSPSEAGSGLGGGGIGEARGARGAGISSVTYVEKADPMAPAFAAAALGATIVVFFGAFALISGVLDTSPDLLAKFAGMGHQFLIIAGGGIVLAFILGVVGMIIGKAAVK